MTNLSGTHLNNGVAVGPQGEGRESPSTFPKYPAYKDSRVPWIGEVPVTWEVKPFKWLIDNNDSGVWGDDPTGEGDTLVLRSTDQTVDGNWKLADPAPRKLSAKEKASALLVEGDLVVTKSSGSSLHIGKTTLVTADIAKQGCCYGNFMQRLRVNSSFTPKLAWYVMNNELARAQLDLLSNSTTGLANLNGTLIGEILVPVSTVAEQTQIARFLDHETARIDALIAEQQRLIELLKEKRQAVISHAVTKGLNPDAPMKDSGVEWLGQVPAHWVRKRLKNISPFITVGIVVNPSDYVADEGLPFLYGGEVKEGFIEVYKARKISPEHSRKNRKTMLEAGDIVTMRVGYPGLTAVVPPECAGGNCASVMLVKRGDYDSHWLCAVMNSRLVRQQVEVVQYGAAQKQINIADAIEFWMFEPPIEEQAMIAEFIGRQSSVFNALMEQSERSMLLLQERRSALISAAVTGKIDVRGWQPPAENPASIAHTIQ